MKKVRSNKEYEDWIAFEKKEAEDTYRTYKDNSESFGTRYSVLGTRKIYPVPERSRRERSRRAIFSAAAAILILAMGTTIWIKKDDIFKPKYSEDQIELAYKHTIKILSSYSQSLSKGTSSIKDLNLETLSDDI